METISAQLHARISKNHDVKLGLSFNIGTRCRRGTENSALPNLPVADCLVPKAGVVTLFGFNIQVRVDRGHLLIDDGIGSDRRQFRLPRVGHGLSRLVIVGSDGMISLAAFRWLADQDAAFVMLDRDGSVLATTGPVRPSDARLRRAQATALQSGAALRITRELISQKLAGQERVARTKLLDSTTADVIARFRAAIKDAETIEAVRQVESQGASAYWAAQRLGRTVRHRPSAPSHPHLRTEHSGYASTQEEAMKAHA